MTDPIARRRAAERLLCTTRTGAPARRSSTSAAGDAGELPVGHHRRAPRDAQRRRASSTSRHMGEVHFRGPRAAEAVQRLVTNDVAQARRRPRALHRGLPAARAASSTTSSSTAIAADHFLIVVNACNVDKDVAWFRENVGDLVRGRSTRSDETALIAFQGPKAEAALQPLTGAAAVVGCARSTSSPSARSPACRASIARTGYTAEDGFEIFCDAGDADALWDRLVEAAAARRRQAGRPGRARHAAPRRAAVAVRQRPRARRPRRSRPGSAGW